jgi:hypothetical protein
LELEAAAGAHWRGAIRAAAFRVELRDVLPARRSTRSTAEARDPWDRYGSFTQDWAERWELSSRLEHGSGPWNASLSMGIGAPAQEGALFTRAAVRVERRFGRVDVGAGASLARLTPSGRICAEGTLALGVRWGGVP